MKLSPEEGTRSWYEEGTELVRTRYEGSGAPLSIDKGKEDWDHSDQYKLRGRQRPRQATKALTEITRQLMAAREY